jgi:hypothetical protein
MNTLRRKAEFDVFSLCLKNDPAKGYPSSFILALQSPLYSCSLYVKPLGFATTRTHANAMKEMMKTTTELKGN